MGDGKLFKSLTSELDALNGGKKNNNRDALIAEAAIAGGYTLLTADRKTWRYCDFL
jgi:predicted nucleic acid-binding protein